MKFLKISNKSPCEPRPPKKEPDYIEGLGWAGGYEFKQFLGNTYAWLGELQNLDGVQQLIHHYYLQNGGINARNTAQRIRLFLNKPDMSHLQQNTDKNL